jgi:hypothetical protein
MGTGIPDPALDFQLLYQVQKPWHRSSGLDAHQRGSRESGIKFPHLVAFVHQLQIHYISGRRIQNCQRLLASVQITAYNSHSASFGPSGCSGEHHTVRVNEIFRTIGSHNLLATPSLRAFDNPEMADLRQDQKAVKSALDAWFHEVLRESQRSTTFWNVSERRHAGQEPNKSEGRRAGRGKLVIKLKGTDSA